MDGPSTRLSIVRSRWAAIGAAVAVTLGAGGIGVTHAVTGSGDRPIYRPLDSPCRLADLRPAPFTVGPRTAPLGPSETETFDGWGAVGNCNLPNGTRGLALNVTAVDPTQATFLRFWPADGAQPETANLNPTPGQPPTPNAVNVGLAKSSGEFEVFNRFGSVSVIIDVVGVFDHHHHDDRYYTEAEIDAKLSGRYLCTGFDFFPSHSTVSYATGMGSYFGERYLPSTVLFSTFFCGVHLPEGSTVTELRATVRDSHALADTSCALRRADLSSGIANVQLMATTDHSSGSDGVPQDLSTTSINEPVVTFGHSYWVFCETTSELRIISATVVYEVD